MTAHTSNLVWFHIISKRAELQKNKIRIKADGGKLADIIPTMLEVMKINKPQDMDGISLIEQL